MADANHHRDPAAFEAVFHALLPLARGRVLHRLPPRLRRVLAVDSSFFHAVRSMIRARYRRGERGVRAHLDFDPDQHLPDTLVLRPGATGSSGSPRVEPAPSAR